MTKVLAKMFSDKDSQLSTENRPLWQSFLGRYCSDVLVAMESTSTVHTVFQEYFVTMNNW